MKSQIQKELDELLKAGVITEDEVGRIRDYYRQNEKDSSGRFNIVLGVSGALLAGLGIVLLIAHNWDTFSKPVKILFAGLPVLVGQLLCLYTLIKRPNNIIWREASGVILFFGVGSCLSLISQIYHINEPLSNLLLTWTFLCLPLVYIMRSTVIALVCIATISWYACTVGYFEYPSRIPWYYLLVVAILFLHYYQYYKNNSKSNFFHLLNWAAVLSTTVVLGSFSDGRRPEQVWINIAYASLFSLCYVYGRSSHYRQQKLWANPFLIVAISGILFLLFAWSFEEFWTDYTYADFDLNFINILALAFVVCWVLQLRVNVKSGNMNLQDPFALSVLIFLLALAILRPFPPSGLFLVNLWILYSAIYFIRKGSFRDHLGILNFGLLILAILAVCRFFDDNIPFVWRGLLFLATGISFFAANFILLKKRKQAKPQNGTV